VTLDWTVLGFAIGATGLSALIFGSAPALNGVRVRLMAALRVGHPSADTAGRRLRSGLVIGQLALATVLLVGAGLLVNSFLRMAAVDPGFDTADLMIVELSAPADRYPEMSEATYGLYRDLVESVESVPGVLAAGATMTSPISSTRPSNFVSRSDQATEREDFVQVRWRAVTSGLFDALGVPMLAGRTFTTADTDAAMEAATAGGEVSVPVVLSRSLAERLWPEGDAVGRSVVWGEPGGPEMRVVGIVGDVRDLTFPFDPEPAIYLPHRMVSWPTMTLIVRSGGPGPGLTRQIREAVWAVDDALPIPDIRRMDDILSGALAGPRLNLILLAVFALSALLLAAVGLYGLTALTVASRSREIGVRLALGAPRTGVLGMIVGQGLKLALLGTSLGLLGAAAFTRFMGTLLFGVQPLNPPTFAGVALTLAAVTLAAAYVPARRALKVDPASSLQAD
jgi:putative ABC transport system permease protein